MALLPAVIAPLVLPNRVLEEEQTSHLVGRRSRGVIPQSQQQVVACNVKGDCDRLS